MNLANILRQKLVETPPVKDRHHLLASSPDLPWSATLTFEKRDELSGLVWEMVLHRTGPEPAGETLHSWAERIAQRTLGLMEPVKVVEIDPLRHEGFLRSADPVRHGNGALYFEVFLKGTKQALVRRYQAAADKNGRREQVAFALTHEALCKLVDDLSRG